MVVLTDISNVEVKKGHDAYVTVTRVVSNSGETAYVHCQDNMIIRPFDQENWPAPVTFLANEATAQLKVLGYDTGARSLTICINGSNACPIPDYSSTATVTAALSGEVIGQAIPISSFTVDPTPALTLSASTSYVIKCMIELKRVPEPSDGSSYVLLDVTERTLLSPEDEDGTDSPVWPYVVEFTDQRKVYVDIRVQKVENPTVVKIFASTYPHVNPFIPVVAMKPITLMPPSKKA